MTKELHFVIKCDHTLQNYTIGEGECVIGGRRRERVEVYTERVEIYTGYYCDTYGRDYPWLVHLLFADLQQTRLSFTRQSGNILTNGNTYYDEYTGGMPDKLLCCPVCCLVGVTRGNP